MNCKQARALFSPRVDNELNPSLARHVDDHLHACPDCAVRWSSFETTVRMVRTLPQLAPDPSFVGQVLDKVRGYEAADRQGSLAQDGQSIWARAGDGLRQWDWRGLLFPARVGGALAFGALAGFVLVWAGVLPGVPGSHQRATLVAHSATPAGSVSSSPEARADRPFADLAAELSLDHAGSRADSSSQRREALSPQPSMLPPGELLSGTQQVKLSGSSGHPQITF